MHRLRSYGTSIFGPLAMPRLRRKALNSWSAAQETYFSTKDIFERHRVVFTISTSLASIATAWVAQQTSLRHPVPISEGVMTLNFNGSALGNPGLAGIGGTVRDERGNICWTFSSPVGLADSTKAEVMAALTGIRIIKNLGIQNLIIAGYSLRYLHQAKVEERLESIEKAMKNNYHIEHAEIKKIVGSGSISTTTCIATAGTSLIIGYGLGWRGGKWYANRKFRREQMKLLGQIKPKRWQFQFLRRPYSKTRLTESSTRNSEAMHNGFTTTLGSRQAPQSC